jgi:hypothetical protein
MFGSGTATNIELLRIEWPSGVVQEFRSILPRQFLAFQEPTRFAVTGQIHGVFSTQLAGTSARTLLQYSTNLREWLPLTNSSLADGTFAEPLRYPALFLRAVTPQP